MSRHNNKGRKQKRPWAYAVSSVTPALCGGFHTAKSVGENVSGVSCTVFLGGGMYPDYAQSVKQLMVIQFYSNFPIHSPWNDGAEAQNAKRFSHSTDYRK